MSEPTRVVTLTAGGRGAVASILVAGPQAEAWVAAHFESATGRALAGRSPVQINYGRWRLGGELREEVVVRRVSPVQFELHCHGGHASVSAVLESLTAAGAERQTWQEWLDTAEPDPLRAAARRELAQTTTERAALVLLDQYHGALRREIDELVLLLAATAADVPAVAARLDALIGRGRQIGLHLTSPWRIVLTGVPNVGKSSLINALLGYQRAIVFDQPGTTRDVLTAQTAIDGWPVELSDTAGLRESADALEAAGVAYAQTQLAAADVIVWVRDLTQPAAPRPNFPAGTPVIAVDNKCDLPAVTTCATDGLRVSAQTGTGLRELVANIAATLVPQTPIPGAAVPFLRSQLEVLTRVGEHLAANQPEPARELLAGLGELPAEG